MESIRQPNLRGSILNDDGGGKKIYLFILLYEQKLYIYIFVYLVYFEYGSKGLDETNSINKF